MENNESLNICSLFSVCSQLVLAAGKVIKEVYDKKDFLVSHKTATDPYTEADVKAQTLIIQGLRTIWPNIKIIGEEEEEHQGEIDFKFSELKTDIISKDLFKGVESLEIPLKDIICWVDPLDGTANFVEGVVDSVTTLIGLSVKGESKIGIIGKFFTLTGDNQYEWTPRCYFAYADHPHVYYVDYLKDFEVKEMAMEDRKNSKRLIICATSGRHRGTNFQESFDRIKPDEVIKVSGAGTKALHVLENKSDCYFHPKTGIKKWDVCAGEALIKSAGGVATNGSNKPLKYEEAKDSWVCEGGFVATITPEKHELIMKHL